MTSRRDGMDRARKFLEKDLEAKIGEDRDWRYAVYRPLDQAIPGDDFEVTPPRSMVVPAVKISMHPAQYERLLGMLSYLISPEEMESLGYRTPREMQAYDVMLEKTWEKQLQDTHPTVKSAYEQYITAIKLCT